MNSVEPTFMSARSVQNRARSPRESGSAPLEAEPEPPFLPSVEKTLEMAVAVAGFGRGNEVRNRKQEEQHRVEIEPLLHDRTSLS
jgi:hypothetical protein